MSKTKIMIVDDSPLVIEVVGSVLRGAGYEVVTRSVAVGASAAILRERPALVLIDVSMPLVTGTEISQSLRGSRATNESVIVLHSDRPADQLEALVKECGADGYVRKTGNPRELLTEVTRWLAFGARRARGRGGSVLVASSDATHALVKSAIGTRATVRTTDSGTEALRMLYARDALRGVVIGSGLRDLSAMTLWRKALEIEPRLRGRVVVVDEGGRDDRSWPADVVWWTRGERVERLLEALALDVLEG